MKGKKTSGRRMGEATDPADTGHTTKISLRFPISAGLPVPTAQNHCPTPLLSPSPVTGQQNTRSEDGMREMDNVSGSPLFHTSIKNPPLQVTAPHTTASSSSSCSSFTTPIDLTALARMASSTTPPFPSAASLQRPSSETAAAAAAHSGGFPSPGDSVVNGSDPDHSTAATAETAHILFTLSTKAFKEQVGRETGERTELSSKSNHAEGKAKQRKLSSRILQPENLAPSPSALPLSSSPPPSAPPPPSSLLPAPPCLPSDGPHETLKRELLCGVCQRLFSSASALTSHMRLHRGGRLLSCHHCGKVFIHNKRLQSHEAVCRKAPPAPLLQPKLELLTEGDVDGEVEGDADEPGEGLEEPAEPGQVTGTSRPMKKGKGLLSGRHRVSTLAHSEGLLKEDDHFIKVVDGHIIYFCTICERSYMTLSSLKRHSNVHSWRRKYPCHFCDKVFALAEYRTKHEVWHTGERRYQCIFCWDAFPTYYNLKTHQKAVHGISPNLISSEKTVNGGYKQKVNALKLYRLLPMRSQKRPYKTYSHPMADGLMLQAPEPLPLDGDLPPTLGTGEQQPLLTDTHPGELKEDMDAFPISLEIHHDEAANLTAVGPEALAVNEQGEGKELAGGIANSKVPKPPKVPSDLTTAASTVISYGHTKQSVIRHSTAVSSSVIVHSKQISAGSEESLPSVGSPGPLPVGLPEAKTSPCSLKNTEGKREGSTEPTDISEHKHAWAEKPHHKVRKSHNKNSSHSSKGSSHGSTTESKGPGPVCQITMRIGEEAIVKRSISETDLRRDKDLSSKARKSEASSLEEPRHAHHHHHRHKHRSHRSSSKEEAEGEPRKKTPKVVTKERDYYFRQEVREQDSDQDVEDNLWRPYYAYKPKRKHPPNAQKMKSWQRKVQCKRSLRHMPKSKTHQTNHKDNGTDDESMHPQDRDTEESSSIQALKMEEEESEITQQNGDSMVNKIDTPSKPLRENSEGKSEELTKPTPDVPALETKASVDASNVCTARPQQGWPLALKAAECGTCGRWFSTVRKRDKHELTHLIEFICMLCQASFHSQARLEEHQKTQHPRPCPKSTPSTLTTSNCDKVRDGDGGTEQTCDTTNQDCPAHVDRKPFVRHTCPQCNKMCKTATALSRHISRHELRSPSVATEAQLGHPNKSPALDSPNGPNETNGDQMHSTPLINDIALSPAPEQKHVLSECGRSSSLGQICVAQLESHAPDSADVPEALVVSHTPPVQSPQRGTHSPPLSPVGTKAETPDTPLIPTADGCRFMSSPNLHSVLVLNGPECLDYRTSEKKSLDALDQRKNNSLAQRPTEWPNSTYSYLPAKPQVKSESALTVPLSTESSRLASRECDGHLDRVKQGTRGTPLLSAEGEEAQDLRVSVLSCDPCENEAQDLSMPTILAKEREKERERERQRKREREFERERLQQTARVHSFQTKPQQHTGMPLLVPKEEAMSPVPSPKSSSVPTNTSTTLHRRSKSPRHSPLNASTGTQAKRAIQEAQQQCLKLSQQRHMLPPSSSKDGDLSDESPSGHPTPLRKVSEVKGRTVPLGSPEQTLPDSSGYAIHDFPMPFLVPGGGGGYHSGKKQEDNLLMSYPSGPLPFASLGKMVVPGDLAKLPLYRDPYPLLCAPQLLAYPYNLTTLPMALNMMGAPGDKAEQLPFLPTLFNYATAAAPYASLAPHPLVANPSLYGCGSTGSKKRDGATP